MSERGNDAAQQFHKLACQELKAKGLKPTNTMIAGIVETAPQRYGQAVLGKKKNVVSLDGVLRWANAWERKGWPAIVMTYDKQGLTLLWLTDFDESLQDG